MKQEGSGALRILGIIMIIFGISYAILGTLSLLGIIMGPLPGHEEKEIIIVILTYITLLISIIGGTACIKGKIKSSKKIGVIFAIIGIISLIYSYITQEIFNNFDCITIVIGLGIIILATLAEIENKKLKEIKNTPKVKKEITEKNIPKIKKEETEKIVPKAEKVVPKTETKTPVKSTTKETKHQEKKTTTTTKKKETNKKVKPNTNTKAKTSTTKKKTNTNTKKEKSK